VAIVAILSGVVGVYVLQIAGQQETAPAASFSSEQRTVMYCQTCHNDEYWSQSNLTTVVLTHAGGETLDERNLGASVNGNASLYGADETVGEWAPYYPTSYAVPRIIPTLGTNEPVTFEAGSTWRIHSMAGGETWDGVSHQNYQKAIVTDGRDCIPAMHYGGARVYEKTGNQDKSAKINEIADFNPESCMDWDDVRILEPLERDDVLRVTWTSSSGGTSQTLFRYVLQDDAGTYP
jgi:hypothetical protein